MRPIEISNIFRSKHSSRNSLRNKALLFAGLFLLHSSIVSAASTDSGIVTRDIDLGSDNLSWQPGEKYDPHTGTLNYASSDIYLSGNGKLPVEVKRVFYQRSRNAGRDSKANKAFGAMSLAIPSVTFTLGTGRYRGCHKSAIGYYKNHRVINDDNERQYRNITTPLQFSDGTRQISFYKVTPETVSLFTLANGNVADYVSADNWRIECSDPKPSLNSNIKGTSRLWVYSPEGITYKMSAAVANDGSRIAGRYLVDEITDAYGNYVIYGYSKLFIRVGVTPTALLGITASDGRRVSIKYKDRSYNIESITSNGQPHPRVITYDYHDKSGKGKKLTVTENGISTKIYTYDRGTIDSITYPAGGKIEYEYDKSKAGGSPILGLYYDTVSTRTSQPDGSKYTFEIHQHTSQPQIYSRLIRSENGAKEFRYRMYNTQRTGRGYPYFPDSGQLVKYKVFDNKNVIWSESATQSLLLERSYEYKTLYNIDKYSNRKNAARIVPSKVTTVMGNGASQRTKDYQTYDFRGYPTKIVESYSSNGTTGKSRTIVKEYDHEWINSFQKGLPVLVSIDGIDTTETTYNRRDIETITKNGKLITTFQRYQSGDSKGELELILNAQEGTTKFEDYYRGHARKITNPRSIVKHVVVNSDGTIKSSTRFADETPTEFTYETLKRIKTIDPARKLSRTQTFTYNNNHLWRKEDNDWIGYDSFGKVIVDSKWDSKQSKRFTRTFKYDSEGNLTFESNPLNLGPVTALEKVDKIGHTYQYDALGRLTSSTHNGSGDELVKTKYEYGEVSDNGNLSITRIDARKPNGRELRTKTEYQSYGTHHYDWPVAITDADGTKTTIIRNTLGNIESHSRAGVETTYQYNEQNLVRTMFRPEDGFTYFTYYEDGSLKSRQQNYSRKTVYYYYPDLKLRQKDHTSLTDTQDTVTREFVYDDQGNLGRINTSSSDGSQNNRITYGYDKGNNLTSELLEVDDLQMKMEYRYDERSNRNRILFPNRNYYDISPNRFGNPTSIKQLGREEKVVYDQISYHPNQNAELMQRNVSHKINMTIDNGQRPSQFDLQQYGRGRNTRLAYKQYYYDKSNNVFQINDTVNERYSVFSYDDNNQLTAANFNNADNWTFSYLPTGDLDWTQHGSNYTDYKYDPNNGRLRKVKRNGLSRNFEYDDSGNTIKHDRLNGSNSVKGMTIDFNAANQLVETGDGTKYAYDTRGLRIKKSTSGGSIYTLYDQGEKLIYRYDASHGVTSEYFYINGKLVTRRDIDVTGDSSTPTQPSKPTQSSDPSAPTQEWPFGDGITSKPVYKWIAIPNTSDYYITIEKLNGNDGDVIHDQKLSASEVSCSSGTGSCRITIDKTRKSGSYRWMVMAKTDGVKSDWSNWMNFSTRSADNSENTDVSVPSTAPDIPTIQWPAGEINNSDPQFQWTSVSGATGYALELRNSDGSTPIIFKELSASEAQCSSSEDYCIYKKEYFKVSAPSRWRVMSSKDGKKSEWSNWKYFNVK